MSDFKPKAPTPAEPMTFDPGDPEYVNYGSESPAPAEGAEQFMQDVVQNHAECIDDNFSGVEYDTLKACFEKHTASLREQLSKAQRLLQASVQDYGDAKAENERLREALGRIVQLSAFAHGEEATEEPEEIGMQIWEMAQQVLAGKPKNTKA